MILADGAIGQMMEKVELFEQQPKGGTTPKPWATTGKTKDRERNIITSLHIDPREMEKINLRLQAKYREIEEKEVRYELFKMEDAEYVLTGYGLGARICKKVVEIGREKGYKIGLIRPITLFPFPKKVFAEIATKVKGILDVEMNSGQMVEDVKLSVEGKTRVEFYGRMGGIIPTPEEVLEHFEKTFLKGE